MREKNTHSDDLPLIRYFYYCNLNITGTVYCQHEQFTTLRIPGFPLRRLIITRMTSLSKVRVNFASQRLIYDTIPSLLTPRTVYSYGLEFVFLRAILGYLMFLLEILHQTSPYTTVQEFETSLYHLENSLFFGSSLP